MHIYFSGIGGTAIGPLALIAKQAGYSVSGSDKQNSQYISYLRTHGISNINIGQKRESIEKTHKKYPIDWFVHTSILDPGHEELDFCLEQGIKITKRDELLNQIIRDKHLKLVAVSGTHGKTTTTAMIIWLLKELGLPISYSVGAKIPFGDMGQLQKESEYFIYECDEFDRNFLAFKPHLSVITGISWDHHEIFPTRQDYQQAFRQFIDQSNHTVLWQSDYDYLELESENDSMTILKGTCDEEELIGLVGFYNRLDAWIASAGVSWLTGRNQRELAKKLVSFPGLQRRMEQIAPSLFTDYAHTPEKIRGAMSVALELAAVNGQEIIVLYEPLTNRRQHYMLDDYKDCFAGSKKVYWLPSYLAREDPHQRIIPPSELIGHLSDPKIAQPTNTGPELKKLIRSHLNQGDMVIGMAGGGGGSLDEWLRKEFVD
jgi:UDP-N-acetylmuramate--alanine ligase